MFHLSSIPVDSSSLATSPTSALRAKEKWSSQLDSSIASPDRSSFRNSLDEARSSFAAKAAAADRHQDHHCRDTLKGGHDAAVDQSSNAAPALAPVDGEASASGVNARGENTEPINRGAQPVDSSADKAAIAIDSTSHDHAVITQNDAAPPTVAASNVATDVAPRTPGQPSGAVSISTTGEPVMPGPERESARPVISGRIVEEGGRTTIISDASSATDEAPRREAAPDREVSGSATIQAARDESSTVIDRLSRTHESLAQGTIGGSRSTSLSSSSAAGSTAPVDSAAPAAAAPIAASGTGEGQTGSSRDEGSGDRGREQRSSSGLFNSMQFARDEAPAVARAEAIDQAVKLSQATGRMPTTAVEGLPAQAAPLASSIGSSAQDASTAQFVPLNATADESSPFASRVVRGLHTMLNHRGGSMTMRLDPPELGALRVQMTLRDGTVSAMFTATTARAHHLLKEHLGTLRASLESQGLTVERLTVQTTPSSANSNASDTTGRHDQSGSQSDRQQAGQQADAGNGQSRGHREHEGRAGARRSWNESFDESFKETLAG